MQKKLSLFAMLFLLVFSLNIYAQDEAEDEEAPPAKQEAESGDLKRVDGISITDVRVEPDTSGTAKAVAEIVVSNVVRIKDIKILKSGEIKFPAYVSRSGREYPQFEPVTKQAREAVDQAIRTKKTSEISGKTKISYKIVEFNPLKSKTRKVNAKILLNNSVEISCGVMEGKKGPWIAWPAARDEASGKFIKQVIFINKKLKDTIEKAMISRYVAEKASGAEDEDTE